MKKHLFCIAIFLSSFLQLQGQDPEQRIIPPSPNAASLGEYGEVPVSLYNGLPNIQVPIYSMTERDISVPISLSYHADGNRVDEEASWVGLGWSLSAGGVITRTVRGNEDLLDAGNFKGYAYSPKVPSSGSNLNLDRDTHDYLTQVCNDVYDTEPDVFFFNMLGKSGRFYLTPEHNSNDVELETKLLAAEKTRVIYNTQEEAWHVWTSDGYEYIFSDKEYTESWIPNATVSSQTIFSSPLYDPTNNFVPASSTGSPKQQKHISAWYLSKIISPLNEEVTFHYKSTNTSGNEYRSISQVSASESTKHTVFTGEIQSGYQPVPTCAENAAAYRFPYTTSSDESGISEFGIIQPKYTWGASFDFDCFYNATTPVNYSNVVLLDATNYSAQRVVHEYQYLERIECNNGRVEFITEDRDDIEPVASYATPQRLKTIKVIDDNAGALQEYEFHYTTMNKSPSSNRPYLYKRLQLDYIEEKNGIIEGKKYQFDYDDTTDLPEKTSLAQDHWGYYNGQETANASSLITYYTYPNYDGTMGSRGVANRESTLSNLKAGILEKITYPTKGSTVFEYELNDFEIYEPNINTKQHYRVKTLDEGDTLLFN